MTSKQKKQGLSSAGYNAGSNSSEEYSTELGLSEQGKASKAAKANRTSVTTTTTTTKKS